MWYNEEGKDYDVVISTRIRYARNINGYVFPNIMTLKQKNDVVNDIEKSINNKEYKILRMKDIDSVTQESLKEKHLISKEFIGNENGAIVVNEDNSIVAMINEEDHLRIQSFGAGFCLKKCYDKLNKFTNELNKKVEYAKNENYGYITACPTNVGSGMRVSVMLHLPALGKLGLLNKLFAQATDIGMSVRGMYGENSVGRGYIYQISNQRTLGMSDENIISNIEAVITTIIEQERKAREVLRESSYSTEDEICRAYGILKYARIVSIDEALNLLSKIRLGVSMKIIDNVKLEDISNLMIDVQKNSLELKLKEKLEEDENLKRAEYIRKVMN